MLSSEAEAMGWQRDKLVKSIMIIIFDLDYTLLDTKRQKKDLARALSVSWKDYQDSYTRHFTNKKVNYNVYKHLSFLLQEELIEKKQAEQIRKKVRQVLDQGNRYLFSSAEKTLKELRKKEHKLILLSFGDKTFQKDKISKLKIKQYFSRIIVTNLCKSTSLDFLKPDNNKIVIVNDNARETKKLVKELGTRHLQPQVFLVKGDYNYNIKNKFPIIQLNQIQKNIEINYLEQSDRMGNYKIIAKSGGHEIGRAYVAMITNSHRRPYALLEDVFVETEYRGEGVGKRLVEDAIQLARNKKCYKMVATSRYSRPKVHAIYKRIGFREQGKAFRMDF